MVSGRGRGVASILAHRHNNEVRYWPGYPSGVMMLQWNMLPPMAEYLKKVGVILWFFELVGIIEMPIHWVGQRGLNGVSTPAALIHRTNYVAPPGGMLLLQTRTLFQKWNALIASLRDNRWWRALNCRASPLLHASPIQPTCPCAMLHCCQQSLQRYRGWKPLVIVTLYSWSGCSLRFNAS